jgi:hypothetical protein
LYQFSKLHSVFLAAKVFEEDKCIANKDFNEVHLSETSDQDNKLKIKKSQSTVNPESKQINGKQSKNSKDGGEKLKTGRWIKDEHFRFLEALKMHGKEWKKV